MSRYQLRKRRSARPVQENAAASGAAAAPGGQGALGQLGVLPVETLLHVLSFLPPGTTYLDVRRLSSSFRQLALAYFACTFRALWQSGDALALADLLRAIQMYARVHPDVAVRAEWSSLHFITHHSEQNSHYVADPMPAQAPRPDITAPAAVSAILRRHGFSVGEKGAIGFLIELGSRLYACTWLGSGAESGGIYPSSLTKQRFRECFVRLLVEFDGGYTVKTMRTLLELSRAIWNPDHVAALRGRRDETAGPLANFLKRFPKFCQENGGKNIERLLFDLRVPGGAGLAVQSFSSDSHWTVLASVQAWHSDAPEVLPGRFVKLLADSPPVAPDTISRIVNQIASAKTGPSQTIAATGEDPALYAAARDILLSISTREHFPAGQESRLASVALLVADIGAGFRRNGSSLRRAAELIATCCGPLSTTNLVPFTTLAHSWITGPPGRAPRIIGGPCRAFGVLAAAIVDLWASATEGHALHGVEASDLFDPACFDAESVFHFAVATENATLLAPLLRQNVPEGKWKQTDFAPWKRLLNETPMGEKREARARTAALKEALLGVQKRLPKPKPEPEQAPQGVRRSTRKRS